MFRLSVITTNRDDDGFTIFIGFIGVSHGHNFSYNNIYDKFTHEEETEEGIKTEEEIESYMTLKGKYHDELLSIQDSELHLETVTILDLLDRQVDFSLNEFLTKKFSYIRYYYNRIGD